MRPQLRGPQLLCRWSEICAGRLRVLQVDFLTHLSATQGERLFEFLSSEAAWSPFIRCKCLSILGREFWHQSAQLVQGSRRGARGVNGLFAQ